MKRIILISIILLSCELDTITDNLTPTIIPTQLEDSRFYGKFTYYFHWQNSDGIEEKTEYTTFTFNGTTKVIFYTKYSSYSYYSGWSYSGDYNRDYYIWNYECKILNDTISFRLFNNSYSEWSDPFNFEFEGNDLILYDKALYQNEMRLTK